ncbi:MAG: DUF484 family protein [Candidatus Puniceispirillum sp.]|nr:DUF484 family protein [Candidatus Puniceispirillum sp.]
MPSDQSGYQPTAEDVLRYLSENPDFLDKHMRDLKSDADAPDRVNIVDLTPAIAARARKEAQRLSKANESLIHLASENMVNWQRLHHATLALLASTDIAGMCEAITQEFPTIFDLRFCRLFIERESVLQFARQSDIIVVPAAKIDDAIEGQTLFLGPPGDVAKSSLKLSAPSVAIIRLPDQLAEPMSRCVLALGGKTETSFQPNLGTDLLILLAEMLAVTMAARLEYEISRS